MVVDLIFTISYLQTSYQMSSLPKISWTEGERWTNLHFRSKICNGPGWLQWRIWFWAGWEILSKNYVFSIWTVTLNDTNFFRLKKDWAKIPFICLTLETMTKGKILVEFPAVFTFHVSLILVNSHCENALENWSQLLKSVISKLDFMKLKLPIG